MGVKGFLVPLCFELLFYQNPKIVNVNEPVNVNEKYIYPPQRPQSALREIRVLGLGKIELFLDAF